MDSPPIAQGLQSNQCKEICIDMQLPIVIVTLWQVFVKWFYGFDSNDGLRWSSNQFVFTDIM